MSTFDDIDGAPGGFDANSGEQLFYQLLPKELIELNMEIACYHPELVKLIDEGLRLDAYDVSTFFGIILAYCGVATDGSYSVLELAEQASRALVNKRENAVVSINTIPSAQGLVQHIMDMKEGSKEQEIILDSRH